MAAEDGVLLGPIRGPEDISLEYLNTMDIGCARKLVCSNFLLEVYGASSRSEKTQSWIEGVSSRLMQPAGTVILMLLSILIASYHVLYRYLSWEVILME